MLNFMSMSWQIFNKIVENQDLYRKKIFLCLCCRMKGKRVTDRLIYLHTDIRGSG